MLPALELARFQVVPFFGIFTWVKRLEGNFYGFTLIELKGRLCLKKREIREKWDLIIIIATTTIIIPEPRLWQQRPSSAANYYDMNKRVRT